ncbi:DUF2271 domain-containing protein [Paracoccus sp. (in: a-proteobacteria)]|uniref:DUF2271 domain-containing protein n=1 Tax=Paracoccus sp. TaxID=267 RepID=UPI0028A99319|nr:DUF2271 domain-containing protein [Paracoccus sp. (in: a-proteobacteria)]
MKTTTTALCLSLAMLAAPAMAREVTVTTVMKPYAGEGAYLALYLTDAQGAYQGTLWVSGQKAKYWSHLSDWYRATGGAPAGIDAITGASVGSGRTLTVSVELADALIDAGYQIRIDSSVEDDADRPAEVVAPLTTDGRGQPVSGKGFVQSLQYDF